MRDVAFLGFFLACLPAVMRFPHIGAMMWIWLALASPDEYLFGFMTAIPLSKLISGITLVSLLFTKSGRRFYLDKTLFLMLALGMLGYVSASYAVTAEQLNWDIYGKLLKILALAFVLSAVLTSRARLQSALIAAAVALSLSGVAEGFKVLLSGGGHKVEGLAAYGDNNAFALAMAMTLPLLLYLFQTSKARIARLAFMFAMAMCVVAIVGTYSRGGFLGLVTFTVGLILLNRNKIRNMALVAVGAIVLMQAAPASWFERINTLHTATQDDGSFLERVTAWKISTLLAMERPLVGGGFHAIQDTSVWVRYQRDLATLDFIPSSPPDEYGRAAHSIYFELLGDLGFTGLFIFLAMIGVSMRACGRIRRMVRGHADLVWASDLAGMLRLSLIVYLVSGAALSMGYFELLYIVLAFASITQRLVAREIGRREAPVVAPEAHDFIFEDDALPALGAEPELIR